MESTIKQLTITGQAAEDLTKPRRGVASGSSRRKRASVKARDDEDDVGVPEDDELIQSLKRVAVSKTGGGHAAPAVMQTPPPAPAAPAPQPVVKVETPQSELQTATKVVLKPPRQMRVKLQPKIGGGLAVAQPHQIKHNSQTRKARRIKLTVANLTHRFTRAKRVKETTEKENVETIRNFLIQKGVIQQKSKAPEKMLRSMYSDFMLLKDQAL
jgi:hypothetical protein